MGIPGFEKVLQYGRVDQVGVVVRDMDEALKNYSQKLGMNEWYRAAPSEEGGNKVFYNGKEINSDIDFVMGYCGKLQFELISTSGDENIYSKHLDENGEGLHHICFFISDLDRKLDEYRKLGIEPVQTGEVIGKGGAITHYAYMDNAGTNGLTIELSQTKLYGLNTKMSPFMMKVGALTGDLIKVEIK